MNAHKLDIKTARVDGVSADFALDEEPQRLTLTTPEPLGVGRHTCVSWRGRARRRHSRRTPRSIVITFEGEHDDSMAGFYRSSYTKDGEKKHMLVTQFESIDARRAFPCWDEPAFKAVFKVTVSPPCRSGAPPHTRACACRRT